MSTQTTAEYMLLFRGNDWHKGLSPEEIQEVVNQMYAVRPLDRGGQGQSGETTRPGGRNRFAEKGPPSRGRAFCRIQRGDCGILLLEVESLDEAADDRQGIPRLELRRAVEVRPVAPECPLACRSAQKKVRAQPARA